jgi:hypothetical protein
MERAMDMDGRLLGVTAVPARSLDWGILESRALWLALDARALALKTASLLEECRSGMEILTSRN